MMVLKGGLVWVEWYPLKPPTECTPAVVHSWVVPGGPGWFLSGSVGGF